MLALYALANHARFKLRGCCVNSQGEFTGRAEGVYTVGASDY
jgi:hypothetical protein